MSDVARGGISATGRPIDIDRIQISRRRDDGTIVETWAQMDLPKMKIPAPVPPQQD